MKRPNVTGTPEWEEKERKRKAEYNRRAKAAQQDGRRAVTGRRARQVNGVLVPVKVEVPRSFALDRKYFPCDGPRCKRKTIAEPNGEGKRLCYHCGPTRPLKVGKVWRLCIGTGCDLKLQKGPKERGPFLCTWCKRRAVGATGRVELDDATRCPPELEPILKARTDQLRDMYAAAMAYPSESAARKAGVPTRSEELPWRIDRDPLAIADAEDEDDAG